MQHVGTFAGCPFSEHEFRGKVGRRQLHGGNGIQKRPENAMGAAAGKGNARRCVAGAQSKDLGAAQLCRDQIRDGKRILRKLQHGTVAACPDRVSDTPKSAEEIFRPQGNGINASAPGQNLVGVAATLLGDDKIKLILLTWQGAGNFHQKGLCSSGIQGAENT